MNTPMLDKLTDVGEEMDLCRDFLEWFLRKYTVFENSRERESSYADVTGPGDFIDKDRLLAEFFEIDLKKVEEERRAVLSELFQLNQKKEEEMQ